MRKADHFGEWLLLENCTDSMAPIRCRGDMGGIKYIGRNVPVKVPIRVSVVEKRFSSHVSATVRPTVSMTLTTYFRWSRRSIEQCLIWWGLKSSVSGNDIKGTGFLHGVFLFRKRASSHIHNIQASASDKRLDDVSTDHMWWFTLWDVGISKPQKSLKEITNG